MHTAGELVGLLAFSLLVLKWPRTAGLFGLIILCELPDLPGCVHAGFVYVKLVR
jgi:hypothetical protein